MVFTYVIPGIAVENEWLLVELVAVMGVDTGTGADGGGGDAAGLTTTGTVATGGGVVATGVGVGAAATTGATGAVTGTT